MNKQKLPEHIKQLIHPLSEDQLHELHNLIADRLNLLHKARALIHMQKFNVLDRVYFDYHGQRKEGTITRFNQRTISVTLDTGEHWKVAPDFLTKFIEAEFVNENPVTQQYNNSAANRPEDEVRDDGRPPEADSLASAKNQKLGRNDSCWCGSGKKFKKCHYPNIA
jgi:uncharacterized protein YecA (UPF0149 family)